MLFFEFFATHIIDKVCSVITCITLQVSKNAIFVGTRSRKIFIT